VQHVRQCGCIVPVPSWTTTGLQQKQHQHHHARTVRAAAQQTSSPQPVDDAESSSLENFLVWLVRNGEGRGLLSCSPGCLLPNPTARGQPTIPVNNTCIWILTTTEVQHAQLFRGSMPPARPAAASTPPPTLPPHSLHPVHMQEGHACIHPHTTCCFLLGAGVAGIGLDSSKVALYEDEAGDRGVLCQEVRT
jgi:hypothetical protein